MNLSTLYSTWKHPLALLALLTLSAFSVSAEQRTLYIYNWNDYIDESVLDDFSKQTGIKVVYSVFDSDAMLETKLLAGQSGFDIVVPTLSFIERQISAGVFQKLDKNKLANLKNMDKTIESIAATVDPDNNHSINYMWGTVGYGLNSAKIKKLLPEADLNSWDLLFNPQNAEKLAHCGIFVADASDIVIPIVLGYLGLGPQSQDSADLARAEAVLVGIRPYIKKFDSSEYISALANGDICLALGYSGDVLQARDRAREANNQVEVSYIIPKEGTQIWFNQLAIPADAPHPDTAHEFLNFIMQPKVIAKVSNYIKYANGNAAAHPFVDAEIRNDPSIYPSDAVKSRLWTSPTLSAKEQRNFNRIWTKLKSSQ